MARAESTIHSAKKGTEQNAREVAANPWVERLMRFGYIARGIVYIVPGILALEAAIGQAGGGVISQTGAIEMIGALPYGRILLFIVALGLAGYSLWGLVRATLDPFHDGDDTEGLLRRAGYIVSGLGYAVLLIACVQYLSGSVVSSGNPQDWTARFMGSLWGRVLVGGIGLGWIIGGGIRQIYEGYEARFVKDLKTGQMSRNERIWAIRIGRFGLVARGIVFGLIGLFLVQAAVFHDPAKAKGLDGALLAVARSPYGLVLLAVVALGLIAFGIYSILCARWMKVRVSRQAKSS